MYYGYANERWVDFRQLNALKPMLNERISMCAAKGFDAVELDDIDSFDPASTSGFHLTIGDAQNYLAYADNLIHQHGMTVMWKNSAYLSSWGRRYTDGAVVEECYVYNECFSANQAGTSHLGINCTAVGGATPCGWDDFTTDTTANQPTGKWVGEIEYGDDHFVCNPARACAGPKELRRLLQRGVCTQLRLRGGQARRRSRRQRSSSPARTAARTRPAPRPERSGGQLVSYPA